MWKSSLRGWGGVKKNRILAGSVNAAQMGSCHPLDGHFLPSLFCSANFSKVCSDLNWANVNSQPETEEFSFSLLHEMCKAAPLECEMKNENVKVGI